MPVAVIPYKAPPQTGQRIPLAQHGTGRDASPHLTISRHATFHKMLDTHGYVAVSLRIMRHLKVTYSSEAAFNALADPTRRAVLDLLRRGSLPAGEIAQAFPISRPAISKHLRLLRRACLVEERREGRRRLYRLNPGPLKAVDSWLDPYRMFWQTSLTQLKAFVEAGDAKGALRPRERKK